MTRDEEQRLIAYTTLLLAGVVTVAAATWALTAAPATAVWLFILGSVAAVVLSIPVGPLVLVFRDRLGRDWAMTARHATIVLVLSLVAVVATTVLFEPSVAVIVAGTILALVALWTVIPLSIGGMSATTGGTSMLAVLVAWPVTNLLALALFVAPTPGGGMDFGRYNVLGLDEPGRSVALLVILAVIAFGPTVLGKLIDRWVYRGLAGGG